MSVERRLEFLSYVRGRFGLRFLLAISVEESDKYRRLGVSEWDCVTKKVSAELQVLRVPRFSRSAHDS